MSKTNTEYWIAVRENAYELLRAYNTKDGCFLFQNKHTTANSADLRKKSKDNVIALEYSIIQGYCEPMVGETGVENLYKVTEKGLDFILEYHFEE